MKIQVTFLTAQLATAYLKIDNTNFLITDIMGAFRSFSIGSNAGGTSHRLNIDIPCKIQEAGHTGSTSVPFITIDDKDLPELVSFKSTTVQQFQGGEITFIPFDSVPVNTVIPPTLSFLADGATSVAALAISATKWPYRANQTESLIGVTSFSGITARIDVNAVEANKAAREMRKANETKMFRSSLGLN